MFVFIAVLVAITVWFWMKRRKGDLGVGDKTRSASLDRWIAKSLERELAAAIDAEVGPGAQRELASTLHEGVPEARVVAFLEKHVDRIDLTFVRYSHETTADVDARIVMEGGKTAAFSTQLTDAELPKSVLAEFKHKATTRVFHEWTFPWRATS